MNQIAFQPDNNGLSHWDYSNLPGISASELKFILNKERKRLLPDLRKRYYDAVDLYNLEGTIDCLISGANQPALTWESGMIFVALDYAHSGFYLPARPAVFGERRSALFLDFLRQRSEDNLRANSCQLMEALAVASCLPDEWFPRELLLKRIQQEVRSIPIYQKPEVELSLAIPPGGLEWMEEATRQAIDQALPLLQSGQPVIFRLVRSLRNLFENRQVIVYGWEELPANQSQQGTGHRFRIHEPACVLHEHSLVVDLGRKKNQVEEICSGMPSLPVLGLLLDQYLPRDVPYEIIPPILRNKWIRRQVYLFKSFRRSD